jgi:hypothetical protein
LEVETSGSYLYRIDEIDQRILAVRKRFGHKNPLLTLLIEAKLLTELKRTSLKLCQVQKLSGELAAQLYQSSSKFSAVNRPKHRKTNSLYGFLSEDYESLYADCWSKFDPLVCAELRSLQGNTNVYSKFIYIIGPNGQWRHFNSPQPMSVSIAGRRNADLFPFHPFLAKEFEFDVLAAGEFSLIWSKADEFPYVLYLNNISGHYKPKDLRALDLLDLVLSTNTYLGKTRILAVCNESTVLYSKAAQKNET